MPEEFVQPDLFQKRFEAPAELDFFVLETKARKVIAELMAPIFEDMNEDRKLLLGLKIHQDRSDGRIKRLEQVNGLEGEKPIVF